MSLATCARCGGLYVEREFIGTFGGTICRCITPLRMNAVEVKMTPATLADSSVQTDKAVAVCGPDGDVPVAWALMEGGKPIELIVKKSVADKWAECGDEIRPLYLRPSPPPMVSEQRWHPGWHRRLLQIGFTLGHVEAIYAAITHTAPLDELPTDEPAVSTPDAEVEEALERAAASYATDYFTTLADRDTLAAEVRRLRGERR